MTEQNWERFDARITEIENARGLRPQNGDILEMTKLKDVSEFEDTYTRDGNTTKVMRWKYMFENKTMIMPITLHKKIVKIMHLTSVKPERIQVVKEGEGLKTKYDAVAL